MYYKPPRKINPMIGYRTKKSMASQAAWDFANKYSSVKMIQCGVAFIIATTLIFYLFPEIEWLFVTSIIGGSILIAVYVIWGTERQLKEKFSENQDV